jgi:hypothetical protein
MGSAAQLVDILQPLVSKDMETEKEHQKTSGTRVFVEARDAAAPSNGASTLLGRIFFRLRIMRWYTAGCRMLDRVSARILNRKNLFKGEALEDFSETLKSERHRVTALLSVPNMKKVIAYLKRQVGKL